jgi:hypothetical protein
MAEAARGPDAYQAVRAVSSFKARFVGFMGIPIGGRPRIVGI